MADHAKPRVAILDDYQQVAFKCADWSTLHQKIDVDVFTETLYDDDALVQRLKPYTIICAMRERTKFRASLLDRLPDLKLIATTGMYNRGIDVEHAKKNGVVVCGTGGKGDSTLEHIWALLLATVRYVPADDAAVKAGDPIWQRNIPLGLGGRTLGLVGLGRLGTKTAKIAQAFEMDVVAWSPHLTRGRAEEAGVRLAASKDDLFSQSDVLSVHMVLSDSTEGMIGAEDLAKMKKSAFFINTSRGPLVNEAALVSVLQNKQIAGAGLDVFDVEPLPLDHPLRKLTNVVLTPHTGYVADNNYEVFWGQTVENIEAFLEGKPKRVMT